MSSQPEKDSALLPEHEGVVLSVSRRSVAVRMSVDCSCEGCPALEICGTTDAEDGSASAYGTAGAESVLRDATLRPSPVRSPHPAEVSESNERGVDVWTNMARYFEPGERVVVSVKRVMGVMAAVWSYVVPALVMLAILIGGRKLGLSGNATGGTALGAAALYYFVLWLLRDRIKRVAVFKLGKL